MTKRPRGPLEGRVGPVMVQTMLVGTSGSVRSRLLVALKKAQDAEDEIQWNMRRSDERYLVHGNGKWVGEFPTEAAHAFMEAEARGLIVRLKGVRHHDLHAL